MALKCAIKASAPPSTRVNSGETGKPHCLSFATTSLWVSPGTALAAPQPCAQKRSGRFAVRQARAAVPGVRVLVGFWRERDPASLDRLRRATSADYLVTSLNEALAAVMAASRAHGPGQAPAVAGSDAPRPDGARSRAAAPQDPVLTA